MPDSLVSRSLFDSAALRRQVENSLAEVEPGHGHAEVKVTLPDGRIEVLACHRINKRWEVNGKASFTVPSKEWGMEVKVVGSW